MASDLLVDERIDDGARLASELVRSGFVVTAAVWIQTQEERLWFLYLASSSVTDDGFANAYRTVYMTLARLNIESFELSQIKLLEPNSPIAADVMALRNRYPARISTRVGSGRLGAIAVEEAYIYPRIDQSLTRNEVIQAVTTLMGRTGTISPSTITLRDGSTILAIPIGVQLSNNQVIVTLHEHATGQNRFVPADEITAIQ